MRAKVSPQASPQPAIASPSPRLPCFVAGGLAATILLLAGQNAAAAPDWKPEFNDRPLSAEEKAKIAEAVPQTPIVEPAQKRRVLVFSATSGFRHNSIPHGKEALRLMGETTGAYEAVISDDPANFEPEALRTFDTVIMLNPTQDFFMPDPKKREEFSDEDWEALQARHNRLVDNLVEYIRQGGGLMGIHSATDACYQHCGYGETIGAYFWGHPWNAKHRVTIVVEDKEHATIQPVFGDMDDFELVEEIYQFREEPYSRDKLRILLHLDPGRSDPAENMRRKDNDYPVAWVQMQGDGRVFYTSIGHNPHIFWNPLMLKHYLAGIQFTCGDIEADTTPSGARAHGAETDAGQLGG
jgi:type 1 glutamine amidotransferase